jgi:GrxC family glutaredoxin
MAKIEVYSKEWCPYCAMAKALLRSKHLEYVENDVTSNAEGEQDMIARSRRRTVPQIFIDDQSVGGYDDLAQLNAPGELDRLLDQVVVARCLLLVIFPPSHLRQICANWNQMLWHARVPHLPCNQEVMIFVHG